MAYTVVQINVKAEDSKSAHNKAWEELKAAGWSDVSIQSIRDQGRKNWQSDRMWSVRAGVTL